MYDQVGWSKREEGRERKRERERVRMEREREREKYGFEGYRLTLS